MIETAKQAVFNLQLVRRLGRLVLLVLPGPEILSFVAAIPLPKGVLTNPEHDLPPRVAQAIYINAPVKQKSRTIAMKEKNTKPARQQRKTSPISVYNVPAPEIPSTALR